MRRVALLLALCACAHLPSGSSTEPIAVTSTRGAEPLQVSPEAHAPTVEPKSEPSAPQVLEVIPGRLRVSFSQHEIETQAGKVAVWHWISSGLRSLYQKEISLTIVAGSDPTPAEFGWVAGYFRAVYDYAERGHLVEAGSLTPLAAGAFGKSDRRGVLYVDSDGSGDLEIPENTLSAMFLTSDEYAVAADQGPSRVLGFLAAADRYFPFPFWTDLSHPSHVTPGQVAGSVLTHMRRAMLPECSITLEDKSRLVLRVPRALRNKLGRLQDIPLNKPTAFLTGIDSDVDSLLVWVPGSDALNVIGPSDGEQKRLGGAFLGIATSGTQAQAGPVEDGFVVMMSADSWKAFRQALLEGKSLELKLGDGFPSLALEWGD